MMGMFDYVRSEIALPDGFEGQLQSKDFDCALTTIYIRESGRLEIERGGGSEIGGIAGSFALSGADDRGCVDLDFHGDFNFYGGDHREWHEYLARFTDGKLVSIKSIAA